MVFLMLVGLWLSWGVAYPVTGWALGAADAISMRLIIMPLAGLVQFTGLALAGKKLLPASSSWKPIAIAALFNMVLFQVLMVVGISMTGPGKTSIIIYTMPAWAALFAVVCFGQTVTTGSVVSLGFGFAAVVLVLIGDPSGIQQSLLGTGIGLAAAASFGFGTVYMKRVEWADDLTLVGTWQFLIGSLILIPIAVPFQSQMYLDLSDMRGLLALVYLTLIANVLAYFLWFRIIRALPVAVAGITTLVVPCVGVSSSALLSGYAINVFDMLALVLVLVSIAVVTFEQALGARSVAGPT